MYYRKEIWSEYTQSKVEIAEKDNEIFDPRLAKISISVLLATIAGFIISEMLHFLEITNFSLSAVALLGATAIYAFSRQRVDLLKKVDYSVLVFFGGMFVVTSALWSSGAVTILFMNYIPTPNPNDLVQDSCNIRCKHRNQPVVEQRSLCGAL